MVALWLRLHLLLLLRLLLEAVALFTGAGPRVHRAIIHNLLGRRPLTDLRNLLTAVPVVLDDWSDRGTIAVRGIGAGAEPIFSRMQVEKQLLLRNGLKAVISAQGRRHVLTMATNSEIQTVSSLVPR